jgi:hypothetical protein
LRVASRELIYTIWNGSVCQINRYLIGVMELFKRSMEQNGRDKKPSEELTSPNAERKKHVKEGIPSDDDLWDVVGRRFDMLLIA